MTTDPRATRTETITGEPIAMLSRSACGTCKQLFLTLRPIEHESCKMRAVLATAPDAPDYEELLDLTEQQRTELPARFHTPVFVDSGAPALWLCAVCGNADGSGAVWPCATATKHGREVFER